MIQVTTAIRKICGLKKRIWVIRGGQGSGKTFSILEILINHALSNNDKFILVCSEELTKMKKTVIKDFKFILKEFGLFDSDCWKSQISEYHFKNGSIIAFLSLDKDDVGKGLRSDISFFNEANKVNFLAYNQIASRSKRVILDYNPDAECYIETEVLKRDDAELLVLTFEDNEALGKEERESILQYKKDGYNEDGTIKNEFWANYWRVYGCGLIGSIAGAIFTNWCIGQFDESLQDVYGLDFGSDDPDAFVRIAVDEKNKFIYIDELFYKSNNSTDDLIFLIKKHHNSKSLIIADSAGKRTIDDIKRKGIPIQKVVKNKILEDIKLLQSYKLIITERSANLQNELVSYVYKNGIPIDKNNHAIDAFRYAAQTFIRGYYRITHKIIRR